MEEDLFKAADIGIEPTAVGVKAREYPMIIQSTVITQVVAKLCAAVESTFFLRTMPP